MSNYDTKPNDYFDIPRSEMLQFIPDKATSFLEIGCGTGAFGMLIKRQRSCRYVGVEILSNAAELARTRLDEIIIANIENLPMQLPIPKSSFDCIVCNDVLEHLVDPWTTLRALTEYLQPNGHVVISLPNVRFSEVVKNLVFRKKWEYEERGVLDRTHLRFFTASSARSLVENAGLEVIKLEGINAIKYAWRLHFLNLLLLGALNDMRFMQYACVGRLTNITP